MSSLTTRTHVVFVVFVFLVVIAPSRSSGGGPIGAGPGSSQAVIEAASPHSPNKPIRVAVDGRRRCQQQQRPPPLWTQTSATRVHLAARMCGGERLSRSQLHLREDQGGQKAVATSHKTLFYDKQTSMLDAYAS